VELINKSSIKFSRKFMLAIEKYFGYSFNDIDVKVDIQEVSLAYAQGDVIVVSKDFFKLDKSKQLFVMAHEISHLYQQAKGINLSTYDLEVQANFHATNIIKEYYSKSKKNAKCLEKLKLANRINSTKQYWCISGPMSCTKQIISNNDSRLLKLDGGTHNSLTKIALRMANAKLSINQRYDLEKCESFFSKGSAFNDVRLYDSVSFASNYGSNVKIKSSVYHIGFRDVYINQSHRGKLQFLHSMDCSYGYADINAKKAIRYIKFCIDIYNERVIEGKKLLDWNIRDYVEYIHEENKKNNAKYDLFEDMFIYLLVDMSSGNDYMYQCKNKMDTMSFLNGEDAMAFELKEFRENWYKEKNYSWFAKNRFFDFFTDDGGLYAVMKFLDHLGSSRVPRAYLKTEDTRLKARCVALGSALHVIQDSFAGSHTVRAYDLFTHNRLIGVGENQENEMLKYIRPIIFQTDYTKQDDKKHAYADYLLKARDVDMQLDTYRYKEKENLLGEKLAKIDLHIQSTNGAMRARDCCAQLLYMIASKKSEDKILKFVEGIFKVQSRIDGLSISGAGAAWSKTETFDEPKELKKKIEEYYSYMEYTLSINRKDIALDRFSLLRDVFRRLEDILVSSRLSPEYILNRKTKDNLHIHLIQFKYELEDYMVQYNNMDTRFFNATEIKLFKSSIESLMTRVDKLLDLTK